MPVPRYIIYEHILASDGFDEEYRVITDFFDLESAERFVSLFSPDRRIIIFEEDG